MLNRRSLLLSSAALAGLPSLAATAPRSKRLVMVFAKGGWDTTYLLDPKRHVADVEGPEVDFTGQVNDIEETQPFAGLRLASNPLRRPVTQAFFERYAQRCAVVNGVFIGSIGHDLARTRLLTGTDFESHPDLTVIVGHERGGSAPIGSVDLSNLQFVGDYAASTLRLGAKGQIQALDRPDFYPAPPELARTYPLLPPERADQDLIRAHLEARIARQHGTLRSPQARRALEGHLESLDRAARFREAAAGLDLSSGSGIYDKATLTLDLFRRGLCHTALLDDETDWDSHYDTASQHSYYEELFSGLTHLIEGLEADQALDDTLVFVVSEMTRSPRRNAFGGKDHWPHTSLLLIGGSARGGAQCGGTTDRLESLPVDLDTGEPWSGGVQVRHDHVLAGLMEQLDVDPGDWLPGVQPYRGWFA